MQALISEAAVPRRAAAFLMAFIERGAMPGGKMLDEHAEAPSVRVPPPLLLDEMLGRLARWLRLLGYDAEWAGGRPDDELLQLAAHERRLLLTRDTGLLTRRPVNRGQVSAWFIRHDLLADQLRQLRAELGLRVAGPPRCLVCNSELAPLPAMEARNRVPPYVAATEVSFKECPSCRRVMWPGTHWQAMVRELRDVGIPLDRAPRASGRTGRV